MFKNKVEYTLAEENLVVLDMPEWSEDGENYYPQEEILRIDSAIRNKYGYPAVNGADVQPWVIGEQKPEKNIYLKFKINSEIQTDCKLAFEEAEEIIFNGEKIAINKVGYFVDKSIFVAELSKLEKGENVLIVKSPIGKSISLENLYLLGDFGVKVEGCEITVIQKPKRIAFGSIVHQGLPFYGAGVTYKLPFTADKDGFTEILSQKYTGALIKAKIDGKDVGKIVFTPYSLFVDGISKGNHVLELELVASRVNTFYALHECSREKWRGEPGCWFRAGSDWSYEYNFVDTRSKTTSLK